MRQLSCRTGNHSPRTPSLFAREAQSAGYTTDSLASQTVSDVRAFIAPEKPACELCGFLARDDPNMQRINYFYCVKCCTQGSGIIIACEPCVRTRWPNVPAQTNRKFAIETPDLWVTGCPRCDPETMRKQ